MPKADDGKQDDLEDDKSKGPAEDKKKDKDEDEDGLDENEVKSARSLYKALKDPETAQELIESLARRAGILDKKGEPTDTKKETKKELGRITAKLKKSLGKDFEKFSDTIGPVLDEAIDEILGEHFTNSRAESTKDNWDRSVEKFMSTHEFPKKVQKQMEELISDSPPAINRKGFNAQNYLERMYKLAHLELGISLKDADEDDDKPRRRGLDRLGDIIEKDAPKERTLDDAIDAAMKGIRFKK